MSCGALVIEGTAVHDEFPFELGLAYIVPVAVILEVQFTFYFYCGSVTDEEDTVAVYVEGSSGEYPQGNIPVHGDSFITREEYIPGDFHRYGFSLRVGFYCVFGSHQGC